MSIVKDGPQWFDISDEASRTYHYLDGQTLEILEPAKLKVTAQPDGGHSHRVETKGDEQNYYVATGWIAVSWEGEFLF